MWILINKKPVNILNITSVSPLYEISTDSIINNYYNSNRFIQEMDNDGKEHLKKMQEKYKLSEMTYSTVKFEVDDNKIYGYMFYLNYYDNGSNKAIYSRLYNDKEEAEKALIDLLSKVNKIYSSIEQIFI